MCGIAGAIGRIEPDIRRAVQAASDAQRHRGPDDDGAWDSSGDGDDGAMFAFRRLAIIDLSPDAHQPMVDTATGNVIIFNGEIYNFRELRRELEALGDAFRSRSDTEVILKAYARWGVDAISRLRGMFALAIWDASAKRVLLARDRLGIKPLYLASIDRPGDRQTVLFASEVRSLLATGLITRRLNPAAIGSYLWNGFVVGPQTMIEGVRLVPAGTLALVDPTTGKCELHRYWDLPQVQSAEPGEAIDRLRHELHTAVRQHLVSDVPLGIFLSGGVDSSAIAALAVQEAGGARIRTFNISFDEPAYDESQYAQAIALALRTEHTDVRLTQQHFCVHLEDALHSLDQPTFDAINTYFVSRAVREAGMTVALAGTGGDELFGGYSSFRDIPRATRLSRSMKHVPSAALRMVASAVARARVGRFGEMPPQTRWGKLGDVFAVRGRLLDLYQISYAMFTHDIVRQLQATNVNGELRSGLPKLRARELERKIGGGEVADLHAISMLELANYIGERLLRDTDASSMAVSLEARVPLLDHEVIEAAATVPEHDRFMPLGKKQLLRSVALGNLDPKVFDRPKSGFVLPIEVWSRQRLKDEVKRTLLDADRCAACGLNADVVARLWRSFEAEAPGMYWSRVWAIFVLLWWCREHRASI
jgi:asparagine synthase (glutamine-hydrolysing)